jgi:hypothetical protein
MGCYAADPYRVRIECQGPSEAKFSTKPVSKMISNTYGRNPDAAEPRTTNVGNSPMKVAAN